ncbi:hypothetical protein BH24CHL6_BH24CHL6_15800 [soil metagenome]
MNVNKRIAIALSSVNPGLRQTLASDLPMRLPTVSPNVIVTTSNGRSAAERVAFIP